MSIDPFLDELPDEPADLDVDPGTLAGGVPLRTAVSHPDEKRLADEAADRYEAAFWEMG